MKVKVNKLPEGYKVKGGKIVKVMSTGGAPYSNTIGKIPRQFANLEAEKGETALTDLTQDGNYELYNIGGARHPSGGTPLSLPPQSFIFSDTAKMKLNKEQLLNFGINSKKKMTPAAVSKKFPLNKYYSALNDEFVDDIGTTSAELMLDKNKMKLSHLAFVSESKKKFEDGLPLAAYPYLMSQDIDPLEFVQKVNKLNEEQAQMQMIDQLPPEEQQQILALQDFTGGQGGPPQGGPQGGMPPMGPPQQGGMPPQGMMPPQQMMARYGGGLPKAQFDINTINTMFNTREENIKRDALINSSSNDDFTTTTPVTTIPSVSNVGEYNVNTGIIPQVEGYVDPISRIGKYGGSLPRAQQGPMPQGNSAVQPQANQSQDLLMQVAQALQQGMQPEEIINTLVQNGIPQEQAVMMIKEVMQMIQQQQPQQRVARYGGSLRRAQYQAPESLQPQMHLPSQRLQEVAEMVPFDASQFASNYPEISYGKDINQGINQGSLVALAEKLVEAQNAVPDPMYDGRYKDDPQGDYAQKGGMIAAGAYNSPSPYFSLDDMIPAGAYNANPLNRFVYGGEEYIDRYRDYDDIPKFQTAGQTGSEYAKEKGHEWPKGAKDPTFDGTNWVFDDGTTMTKNEAKKFAVNYALTGTFDDKYKIEENIDGVIIDEKAEEGQAGNWVDGVWVPGPNDNSNPPVEEVVSSYPGQGGYDDMMNLYNSDDWDVVNDYSYQSYKKMYDSGKYPMGPEMSAEQFEAAFLADQKFKALIQDPTIIENLSITLPDGTVVTGEEALRHKAWDNPNNSDWDLANGKNVEQNYIYRQIYDQLAADHPDAKLPPLPTDPKELANTVKQYQSTYSAVGGLQKHADKLAADGDPSFQNLLKNVNLTATGVAGDNSGSGLMGEDAWSKIDGKYGNTWVGQQVTFVNQDKEIIEKKGGCYYDKNKQPIEASVKAEQECQLRGGRYDRDVCQCIEKTEFKIPELPPKEFWKQDLIKLDALAMTDINKYYPSRQKFTGNFMDPAYKDPTREIAAIGEQAQIAGDLAAQNLSGPALASVLAKIQGTSGTQISDTLNQIQSDNITTYNTAEQFNAGVQTNTDVLNQDAAKIYMDAVNLTDQNYDNAKNELRVELADAHANAWTNRANTYNLNTLTPNYNIDPRSGGIIDITNQKDFYANTPRSPQDSMGTKLDMLKTCMEQQCGHIDDPTAIDNCRTECVKMVESSMKDMVNANSGVNSGNPIVGGYPGDNQTVNQNLNKEKEEENSQYGSELRRELRMRRGGQWW